MSAADAARQDAGIRSDWTREEAETLYALPFSELIHRAQCVHRLYHDPGKVERAQLLSIKTGGCAEDCGYCSQSAFHDTGVKASKLLDKEAVVAAARAARAQGADRFCMGAAWRALKQRDLEQVCGLILAVKAEGLETCVTLGMLEEGQAERLRAAGLDYYNHNLDTSREHYAKVITTRTYEDRLDTLDRARKAGIKLCCGGILGLGEAESDRVGLLLELARLDPHPESVPINRLVPVAGTPLSAAERVEDLDFVRTIAVARLMMPGSTVRLSAGRETMSDTMQALCFLAGANSIFIGEALLTTPNAGEDADADLLDRLGVNRTAAAI